MTPAAKRSWRRVLCFATAALPGCAHDAPFVAAGHAPRPPRDAGADVRVTYNPGVDLAPTWLPDGSGFLYTAQQQDRVDGDGCLALQPPEGGGITRVLCHRTRSGADSLDVWENAAVSAEDRLAFVWSSTPLGLGSRTPDWQGFVLGTLGHAEPVRVLATLPYLSPSGAGHEGISHVAWLDSTTILYLGERVVQINAEIVRTGIEVVRLSIQSPVPALVVVAGTDSASSVTAVGGDTIYYTRNGDTRVYRRVLSTGAVLSVVDFGGEIVRDVQVAGSRLVAVVGGKASFRIDPAAGPTQLDRGGYLHLVDLQTGLDSVLPPPPGGLLWYRHPALAPDGSRVIAEGRHVALIDRYVEGVFIGTDTIIDPAIDLWRLDLP